MVLPYKKYINLEGFLLTEKKNGINLQKTYTSLSIMKNIHILTPKFGSISLLAN